jgi:hypothetical protein
MVRQFALAGNIVGQFANANLRWNQIGLRIEAGGTVNRTIPAAALDANGRYGGEINNAFEAAALRDLMPITPDNTLTVVFVLGPLTQHRTGPQCLRDGR